jgi:AraC-like DNA-binding protein
MPDEESLTSLNLLRNNYTLHLMIMQSVLTILLFIGGAQGLLLSVALASVRRGNRTANRILAVLLFSFSIIILFHAAGHMQPSSPAPGRHRDMIHAFFLVLAPLMYFYTKALTQYHFKFTPRDALHLIPFLGTMIAVLFFGHGEQHNDFTSFIHAFFLVLISVQMLVYLVLMHVVLHNHMNNIQDSYSSLEKINLRWLKFFITSQAVIWPIAFLIDISKHDSYEIGYIWLLVSVFMYLTGYFGILQPEIFSGEFQEEHLPAQGGKKKYERSALSSEQAEAILQRLETFMQSSKPYVIPTLTLSALSKQVNVSSHHLSQIINERLHKNFFEYINHFRVKEAKQLLKDPTKQHLTLAAIGFEAGFNSVSSFNSIFKKLTTFTPSQYRMLDSPSTDIS